MKKQHRGLLAAIILAIFIPACPVGRSVCLVHAKESEKLVLVENPLKDLGRIPLDSASDILVSPLGRHMVYLLDRDKAKVVVLDGRERRQWDSVSLLTFTPNGRHLCYFAQHGEQTLLVRDRQVMPMPADLRYETISPDGQHFAYVLTDRKRNRVFLDGVKKRPWDKILEIRFSPCGRHLATRVTNRGRTPSQEGSGPGPTGVGPGVGVTEGVGELRGQERHAYLVVDSRRGKGHQRIHSFSFSPDGQQVLFWATNEQVLTLYCDLQPILTDPQADKRIPPVRSRNNRRFAYICKCKAGKGRYVVCDGQSGPVVEEYGELVFSPDSKHLAYAARIAGKWRIIIDGKAGPSYDHVGTPVFSRKSKRLAYVVKRGRKPLVICNGLEAAPCDKVTWLSFSADEKHLLYRAERKGRQFIVCDGIESPAHEKVWIPDKIRNAPKKLSYVVADEDKATLVEVPWPDKLDWSNKLSPLKTTD